MKKLLPFVASILLLAACGGNNPAPAATTSVEPSVEASTAEASPAAKYVLTFLEDSELYVDFNFTNAPKDLSVKVGETTLTASGKAKMAKDFTYEFQGEITEEMYAYTVIDTGDMASGSAASKLVGEKATTLITNYLKNFSERTYEYRIYLCLTDKANGWSKTLPGVDETLKAYASK